MKPIKSILLGAIITLMSISTVVWAQSSVLQVGNLVPKMAINDQHDKPWQISTDTKLVLFSG
ncbi:MAG TPA: hypothetical protein PLP38_06525, partial [Polynucleobacter sp.]|nr:hypothetical protein [Polynucleobacter sp.]